MKAKTVLAAVLVGSLPAAAAVALAGEIGHSRPEPDAQRGVSANIWP